AHRQTRMHLRNRLTLQLFVFTVAWAAPGEAQRRDSVRADSAVASRTIAPPRAGIAPQRQRAQPPISSRRAFLYSLAAPGLGQSALRRPNAGALYFGLEMLSIGMALKSAYDLRLAKERARDSVVLQYRIDPNPGVPVLDSLGRPIVEKFAPNRYTSELIRARRTHLEDWIAFLVFNHLFSGADAFVSAQLWDLPTQLGARAAPTRAALSLRISF
ncbi:MAG: hypothetical protein ACT4R6_07475, partial [Gemmatimonadaceae bacterium]